MNKRVRIEIDLDPGNKKQNGDIFHYFGEDIILGKAKASRLTDREEKQLAGLLKLKDKDRWLN